MGIVDSFALVSLSYGGTEHLVSVGDVNLADPDGTSSETLQEIPVYSAGAVVDAFSAGESPALQALGAKVSRFIARDVRERDHVTPVELLGRLRDLCKEDVAALRQQTPLAALRFAQSPVAKEQAFSLLPRTTAGAEKLRMLLALATSPEDINDPKAVALLRELIRHRVAVHPEDIRTEHLKVLLELSVDVEGRRLTPIFYPLQAWVGSGPARIIGEFFRREHARLVLQIAQTLQFGNFGLLQFLLHNPEGRRLFSGEDLYLLFDLMGDIPLSQRIALLAYHRPELFGADHAAYLEVLAPFSDYRDYSGGHGWKFRNEHQEMLDVLRKKRPDLFPKLSLWQRLAKQKAMPETKAAAQLAADEIRRIAARSHFAEDVIGRSSSGLVV